MKFPKSTGTLVGSLLLKRLTDNSTAATYTITPTTYGDKAYDMLIFQTNVHSFGLGDYYFEILHPDGTLYSEVIRAVPNYENMLLLTFSHHTDLQLPNCHLDFTTGSFEYNIYLKPSSGTRDILGKPTYFYEEVVKRRRGFNYYQQLISGKRYVFETLLSEPCMDGLRLLKLFSDITITEPGREAKTVHDVGINVTFDTHGYAAIAVIEFDTDTVVVTNTKARVV